MKRYVRKKRFVLRQGLADCLPLAHPMAHAQVDFGEFLRCDADGNEHKAYELVMSFPYSDKAYVQVFPSQNQECLLIGMRRIFEYIGGVPARIRFDNMSTAVAQVLESTERKLTDGFTRFMLHYRFQADFCNPASGNEKGNVENKVGYIRRNALVPIPTIISFEEFNSHLFDWCENDAERPHYQRGVTIQSLWEDEKPKPLAPKTIRHNLSLISDIFSYAMKMGVVSCNPCSKVTIPKGEAKEKMIYTIEEVTEFLKLLESEPFKYRVFFNLAVFSGFRRGELLGLEWKDVDFENNLISVRRTSCYTAKQGIYTDTTKTKRSQRTIKFPASIMELLKQFKAEQDELAQQVGDKWIDSDRLFVKWNGQPMNNNTPYFWLNEFCEKHGLPFYGLHSFRHLFVSMLVNESVDIVTVSGALGHSTVSTTSNIYCHLLENSQAKVSEAITNVLKIGANGCPENSSDNNPQSNSAATKNEAS